MDYEQDYVLRIIHDAIRVIAKLILGKNTITYEPSAQDSLISRLISMADNGDINDAENLLYEELDMANSADVEAALIFYQHLSNYSASFLEAHDFSLEEVKLGLENIAEETGCLSVVDLYKY